MTTNPIWTLAILLLLLPQAAALSITSVTAPTTITEGAQLHLSFTTDTPATYEILEDTIQIATANNHTKNLTYDAAGIYIYTFAATDGNTTVNTTRTVTVTDNPLTITTLQPAASEYSTAIPVTIQTSIPADTCTVTGTATTLLTQVNATLWNGSITEGDGIHELTLTCQRNTEIATEQRTILVDTLPPAMALGPSGTVNDAVTLTATTDEVSQCRYSTSPLPYSSMTSSMEGTALSHTAELTLADGAYIYYISCQDVYGNAAPPQSTSFTLQSSPFAEISVEGESPRKAGTYEITVEVSEPLQEVPTVRLTYQGGAANELALTEEDSLTYKGFIIIDEDAGERVGTFTFQGKDMDGLTGTEIVESELFRVDTVKPPAVTSFSVKNGSGSTNLSWFFEGENDVAFNIYRSTERGIDYTDHFTTTVGNSYRDFDVKSALRYYYRVAARDEAGNVGELSDEIWASPAAVTYNVERKAEVLDPVLQVGLNERLSELDILLLDADQAVEDLEQESGKGESTIISSLNLLKSAREALHSLQKSKERFEALRKFALTEAEFNERATLIQNDIDAAMAALPAQVLLHNQFDYDELPETGLLEKQMKLVAAKNGFDIDAAYRKTAQDLQSTIRIQVELLQAAIIYAGGRSQDISLITKQITAQEPIIDAMVVETIPKSVAAQAKEITFLGSTPITLEEDPVVQYNFDSLSEKSISYTVEQLVDVSNLRDSYLLVFPKKGATSITPESKITGNSIAGNIPEFVSGNIFLLLGLVVIAGLVVYYFKMEVQESPAPIIQQLPQQPYHPQPVHQPYQQAQPTQQQAPIIITKVEDSLANLLLRGHSLMDGNKYLDARYFYKRALDKYNTEEFPSQQLRSAVHEELELLHSKLQLFYQLSRAHDLQVAGDHQGLRTQLERVQELANALGDLGTLQTEQAKHQYNFLYQRLHTPDRE